MGLARSMGPVLHTMHSRRPMSRRWLVVLPAMVSGAFALLGLHDEGLRGVLDLITFALVCVTQIVRPSILGWALVFAPSAIYAALVVAGMRAGSYSRSPVENFVFLTVALSVVAASAAARPPAADSDDAKATGAALLIATLAEGWVFLP